MAIIPADEKVFMVDKRTNTTYGGSQALQDMQQWYTMQDVADSVLPYKVFTALLTQSGVDDPNTLSSGTLTKGVSYQFSGTGGTDVDFSNVGVTNPVDGEFFIATQTAEPINWDGWSVSYNNGAPVATVLENTIGNVWFEYVAVGVYNLNSDLLFTSKTFIPNGTSTGPTVFNYLIESDGTGVGQRGYFFYKADPGTVRVSTLIDTELFGDSVLNTTPIEIRVYN
jgi:hypothetical protein